MSVNQKQLLDTIDGTPEKRVFHSIISDYDLRTGICELIDNAIDQWTVNGNSAKLDVSIALNVDRQVISVKDNAGGVLERDARLLIAPGATREQPHNAQIGTFGVGGKRAGVALGEHVEIRTRHNRGKSIQIDFTSEWLTSDDWRMGIYEIPDISPGTTSVDISKVRQGFKNEEVDALGAHLGQTYSWFIKQGCEIKLNGKMIKPVVFNKWAYPPKYKPRRASFSIEPTEDGKKIDVVLTAGLIRDRNEKTENYGVYVYCNRRLIVKELRTRDVGYVSGEAGVPHPDASLCRVIIELNGSAEAMPWNSSKSGINFYHPAFAQYRNRVIEFASYYSTLSRRLKRDWKHRVFKYKSGEIEEVEPTEALSTKKKVLPRLPRARKASHLEELRTQNSALLSAQPWTVGLLEAMGVLEVVQKQKLQTRNRLALILLDSNLEIALKEFIVHRTDLFPPHRYTDSYILGLFRSRTNVLNDVRQHGRVRFNRTILGKIGHYYNLRNKLIHERATAAITDADVTDYQNVVQAVLGRLFKVRFPRS